MEKDELIGKLPAFFDGELSPAEMLEIEAWIDESEENRIEAESVRRICLASDVAATMRKTDADRAFDKVMDRIAAGRNRRIVRNIWKIAAAVCVPLMLAATGLMFRHFANKEESVQMIEVCATPGMISRVTLPDSSRVWLNSGSKLRYPSRFGDTRDVELVGEAYFKVSKDKEHKFYVRTRNMTIEVVGTEFNVDAYDYSGRSVKTTLVNGAINMLYSNAQEQMQVLKIYPGQCAELDTGTGKVTLETTDSNVSTSWRYGKIYLNHTPLREALRLIENRYNVSFEIRNDRQLDTRFTGQFVDQRLDVVLEHFSRSSSVRFRKVKPDTANLNGREIIEVL